DGAAARQGGRIARLTFCRRKVTTPPAAARAASPYWSPGTAGRRFHPAISGSLGRELARSMTAECDENAPARETSRGSGREATEDHRRVGAAEAEGVRQGHIHIALARHVR